MVICRLCRVKWCHNHTITGDPLHSRAACTQPCNVNTHSRAHCSPGARLCEQWEHGCVNNGARLCASARLCRGSPVTILTRKNDMRTPQFFFLQISGRVTMVDKLAPFDNDITATKLIKYIYIYAYFYGIFFMLSVVFHPIAINILVYLCLQILFLMCSKVMDI